MKSFIYIAIILMAACSSLEDTKNVTNDIVGSWNLVSVENNFEGIPKEGFTFLSIDYSEMDGYVFSFHKDGIFEQNYLVPIEIDSSHYYEWMIRDSTLTTFSVSSAKKDTFIFGQINFVDHDHFLLKTTNQTIGFRRLN